MDIVRVLRIYEFSGPRDLVEAQVAISVQGEKNWGNGVTIRAATIGAYPEILQPAKPSKGSDELSPENAKYFLDNLNDFY